MKKDIRNYTLEGLKKEIASFGEPAHRAAQIFSWLNQRNAENFKEMTNLPKSFIEKLEEKYFVGHLVCEERSMSKDGTEKFLWKLRDGKHIESVLIKDKKRNTVCLSTQVGCKFKCPFCASGSAGFKRNLQVSEIVNQVLAVQKRHSLRVTNIVFMGMGEPLDNYRNLVKAIHIINHPRGLALGARKITVSTCGLVPGILKMKDLGLQVELSVSLHAASDTLRDKLVPVNRKYPIKELITACREYYDATGRVVTLEYTLVRGMNDSLKEADKLAGIAKRLKAKVNLIVCSGLTEDDYEKPEKAKTEAFQARLRSGGVTTTLRRSKGEDIMAACGQLAAKKSTR